MAQESDCLLIFGITGDLARKMTLRSLYQLEARELLEVPIVGVALEDWTDADMHALLEQARVAFEKPFSRDLASAEALNDQLHSMLDEDRAFRIDHFLRKQAVEGILHLRFANSFLEPLWNRRYISSVQITMAEAFDVGTRGRFYDQVGAMRDVVPNHLLQVLC